jgi:DNA polymerase (family X)
MSKAGNTRGWRTHIPLIEAKEIAKKMVARLEPWCLPGYVAITGSIRRERPYVNDVDIVLIPYDPWKLLETIRGVGNAGGVGLKKIELLVIDGVSFDIYIASINTWATNLLIRTGSADNNVRLCSIAKSKGWHLAANGDGLFNKNNQRIAGDTEESIYRALSVPYQQPIEREVK